MMLDALEWVEAEPSAALLVQSNCIITAANHAAGRLWGRRRDELLRADLCSFIVDDKSAVEDYLRLCARTREVVPGSFRWRAADGSLHEVRLEGTVIRPRGETEPALILIRCRDKQDAAEQFMLLNEKISELSREVAARRRTEAERDELLASERAARKEAERISRVKDEFLATLSHELRTPLNAILGWTQILRLGPPAADDLAKGLEVIERNTRIQTQLIDDLLDMSRIISGKMRLDVQRVDLASVLEAAIQSVEPAIEARNLRLHKLLDSLSGTVMGDPGRLQQVFWNLLTNAVKFTPKGGRIQVLLERVNSHVEVSVIDSGQGIKPEFLPHVFDRFQQADSSTTRQFGGLGLGLAIVRHLVELHGGSVRAKSPGEGKGATFIVSLPVTVLQDERGFERPPPRPESSKGEMECPPAMEGLKVVVVDDEPDSLAMVAKVLSTCGCDVVAASSAAEGLAAVIRERPRVLLSDIGMPGEDGYSLIRKVRSLPPDEGGNTPAVALTAFARAEDRLKAIRSGFHMHLAKPIESAELIAVVATMAGIQLPDE